MSNEVEPTGSDNEICDIMVETFIGMLTARDEKGKLLINRQKPDAEVVKSMCSDIVGVLSDFVTNVSRNHKVELAYAMEATQNAISNRDRIIKRAMKDELKDKQIVRVVDNINRQITANGAVKTFF